MDITTSSIGLGVGFLAIGIVVGYVVRQFLAQRRRDTVDIEVKKLLLDAKTEAQDLVLKAKENAAKTLEEAKREAKEKEVEVQRAIDRLDKKEELLDKKSEDFDREKEKLNANVDKLKAFEERLKAQDVEQQHLLEKVANLTVDEAKAKLLESIDKDMDQVFLERMRKLELEGEARLDRKAKDILATVIQRYSQSSASEVMTTSVPIPSEDVKGKIIGKEGRNIRAIERATGVEIIVDETPGAIVLSSFDSVRRQIAKYAIEDLIVDGRIHPARIEEAAEKAKNKVEKIMKDAAEAAAYDVGIFDLDPRLMQLLGRLKFRTSFGQNVLQHSVEMAHVSGMLAAELGGDVMIAKKGALVHDIGKAVDHEVQGTHVEIGRRILQKFGMDNAVIQAMQSHHEEYPYETLESVIVQTADALSAGRPGARRDSVENYTKRLEDLEGIAMAQPGVEKCYAISAGRELRVFVRPEEITDADAKKMARNIADAIEKELRYPGEVKVMVIRENRVVEFAR